MRISLLSMSLLGAICSFSSASMAMAPLVSNSQAIDAIGKIAPVRSLVPADAVISSVQAPGATDFDGATIGSFAVTASTSSYWAFDDMSNPGNIYAMSYVGGAWRTFTTTLPASWNATTLLVLAETVRDGATSPASPYSLEVPITKTGTVADLTNVAFAASMSKATANNLATSGGTVVTTAVAFPGGWAAKALIKDGSSAQVTLAASNPILDAIAVTIGANITPAGGTAIPVTASLTRLDLWNVATNSTTLKEVAFTGTGSRRVAYEVKPASFVRTAGVTTGLVANLIASPNLLSQSQTSYLNTMASAVNSVLGMISATPPANIKAGLNSLANAKIASTSFNNTAYTTTLSLTATSVGTGGSVGFVATTPVDITSVSWVAEGQILKAIGTVGSTAPKAFSCDLNGAATINAVTNSLKFTAKDGDSFWLKVLAQDTASPSTLDASGATAVAAASRDDVLAMQLQNQFTTTTPVTTIEQKALNLIIGS